MKEIYIKYNLLIKCIFSSLICYLIDISIFSILTRLLVKMGSVSIIVSTITSGLISAICNYFINRNNVFKYDNDKIDVNTFIKFALLTISQIIISSLFILLICRIIDIKEEFIKMGVDSILFIVGYLIKKHFIFNKDSYNYYMEKEIK